jgi:fermentation-respiration switch protein FrsA (DUF1100 family)
MTALKWILLIAVIAYGGLLALMYTFQRALMYFPDAKRTPPAAAGLPQAEELTLKSADGETLIAWYIPAKSDQPVVLYFQGNGGALDLRAGRFHDLAADGTGVLAVSYRGYGGSTGTPSEPGLIRDAQAAYDFARARYPAERIALWGESLGTAVAIALAAERPVAGLVLDAPFTSAADVGAAAYPFVPVRWLIKDSFRSDLRIGKVHAPILMRHGEADNVVPIRFGERLFALANEPKTFLRLPRANHVDLDDHGGLPAVKAFLAGLSKSR